jgi:hypothetical protein
MAMVEDTSVFFSTAEFADTATLNGVGVTGIFDNGYEHGGAGLSGMSSSQPAFTLPASSVPAGLVGKAFVVLTGIGVGNYQVVESQPDGTGMVVLLLERAA